MKPILKDFLRTLTTPILCAKPVSDREVQALRILRRIKNARMLYVKHPEFHQTLSEIRTLCNGPK